MSVVVYRGKEPIKVAPDAPQLAYGIPCRNETPIEFAIHLIQAQHPLNVKLSYIIRKGMLPAAARNAIIERAIEQNINFVLFLDDDVLFPDITFYRLWVLMQNHPEAACITAVGSTKLSPTEPLIYTDSGSGAYWDWPLGVLTPIDGAWAGCMIVRMEDVKKMTPPYFSDTLDMGDKQNEEGYVRRTTWGQDRYFHRKLRDTTGQQIYADTGLILGHLDSRTGKTYILPPNSPCYQRPALGEAFVPYFNNENVLMWRRIITNDASPTFKGYLDWLSSQQKADPIKIESVPTMVEKEGEQSDFKEQVPGPTDDRSETPLDRLRRIAGYQPRSGY